jgi:hypothetical protein
VSSICDCFLCFCFEGLFVFFFFFPLEFSGSGFFLYVVKLRVSRSVMGLCCFVLFESEFLCSELGTGNVVVLSLL